MTEIFFKNATIVTMDPFKNENVIKGDLLIRDNVIGAIFDYADNSLGETAERKDVNATDERRVIDASDYILMPGLINTHGHAAMTLLRSYADDIPLMRWLEEKIFPVEARLTAEDVYWGTMLAIAEMLRSGTTTFTDMYFFMDSVAKAVAESGMRAVLSRGMVGFDDEENTRLKEIKELYKSWDNAADGKICMTLGPHAIYTCPPQYMEKVCELAEELDTPLQIHLSETRFEVENCLKTHGGSPVEILLKTGLFDHRVICAHCVHLSDEDIAILAEKNVRIAHNPGSNLKLGSGIAPLPKMLQAGLKVGLGTDGASSNNNLDMFEEMRLAALIHKGLSEDPTMINAHTAIEMATSMGADALFLPSLGIIREGFKADIIAINKKAPHLSPLHDIEANLVYSACGADVDLAMVDGKILMEKKELLTIDEERILYEAEKCALRLTKKQ